LIPQLQLKNAENWRLDNPIRRILGAYIRQRNQKILEIATSQGIRGNFSWIIGTRNQKTLEISTSQATILLFGQSFLMPIGAHI
jgi:hypothetical protein